MAIPLIPPAMSVMARPHGNPQYVAGVYNDALEFDGDDYVSIDGYKGVTGRHPWSVAA